MQIDIYGTKICPHCKDVLQYLGENNLPYTYKLVPEEVTPVELSEIVKRVVRTVPVIVVNNKEKTFEELREDVSKIKTLDDLTENLFSLSL